jgi:hypothetical protein
MDREIYSKPRSRRRSIRTQTAIESFATTLILSVLTTLGIDWLGQFAGIPGSIQEIAAEQVRWFLPLFLYIWGMFHMIEFAKTRRL